MSSGQTTRHFYRPPLGEGGSARPRGSAHPSDSQTLPRSPEGGGEYRARDKGTKYEKNLLMTEIFSYALSYKREAYLFWQYEHCRIEYNIAE